MDSLEKLAFLVSGSLLALFVFVLGVSFWSLGLRLPTCLWNKKPFNQGSVKEIRPGEYEVHYVAKMWTFDPPVVEVPTGSVLHLYLASEDVHHGFHIRGTTVNLMAVPGAVNYAKVRLLETGDHSVVCHEYCGMGHHNMAGVIRVRPLGAPAGETPKAIAQSAGQELLVAKGCVACHSLDGRVLVGPTFKGLFGRQVTLADGTVIKVDEAYVKESIRTPGAKVVKSFQPLMPVLPVSDTELTTLVDYLKTL